MRPSKHQHERCGHGGLLHIWAGVLVQRRNHYYVHMTTDGWFHPIQVKEHTEEQCRILYLA